MSHIIVTGANGFVGRAVCRLALAAGHTVTALVRRPDGCVAGVRVWVHDTPISTDSKPHGLKTSKQTASSIWLRAST